MRNRNLWRTGAACALLLAAASPCVAQVGGGTQSGLSNPTLRAGDILRISVWPNAEVGGEFVVEESGYVYLPLLEEVRAGGVPLEQLRAELRRRYGEVMRNPVVTVTPVFHVSVTGEVQRPGVHPITPTQSLFDVIALAGGFRGTADPERVRVVRPGEVVEFDALRALETGQGMDAIQLRSGDHVVVPPAPPSRLTWRNALTFLQTASVILITYERLTR